MYEQKSMGAGANTIAYGLCGTIVAMIMFYHSPPETWGLNWGAGLRVLWVIIAIYSFTMAICYALKWHKQRCDRQETVAKQKEVSTTHVKSYYPIAHGWIDELREQLDCLSKKIEDGDLQSRNLIYLREEILPRFAPNCHALRAVTALLCIEELRATRGHYSELIERLFAQLDQHLTPDKLGTDEEELKIYIWHAYQRRDAKRDIKSLRDFIDNEFRSLKEHRAEELDLYQALADAELTLEDIGTNKVELKNLLVKKCRSQAECLAKRLNYRDIKWISPLLREALETGNLLPEEVGTTWEQIAEYERYLPKPQEIQTTSE